MRQDCSAYAEEPLHTVGLLEAAHQYSLQDLRGSANAPTPLHSLLRNDSSRTYCRRVGKALAKAGEQPDDVAEQSKQEQNKDASATKLQLSQTAVSAPMHHQRHSIICDCCSLR